MSEPFIAEIRIFIGNFAPAGWASCDGQLLPIAQNTALFSLIGTTYGGDGRTTFALPDLRGRVPVHPGSGVSQGEKSGSETVTLSAGQMPQHVHGWGATGDQAKERNPTGKVLASRPRGGKRIYKDGSPNVVSLAGPTSAGGGQAHTNMQPFLTLNFVIALQGVFPSRG